MGTKHLILQVNLQKSRAATSELVGHMLSNKISMALVQEPYVRKCGAIHIIPNLNGIQIMAQNNDQFKSAILYNRNLIQPFFIPQLSSSNLAVASVRVDGTQAFIASVYVPPSSSFQSELAALQRALNEFAGHRSIVAGDFNVRSTLWHDVKDDHKSHLMEEFIMNNNLELQNLPGNPPTYRSTNGCSTIDLTLTSQCGDEDICDWMVLENLTISDHNAIQFTICLTANILARKNAVDHFMDVSQIKAADIADELQIWSQQFDQDFQAINTPAEVDAAIDSLQLGITTCLRNKARRRRIYKDRPDWWTDEVERHRKVYLRKKDLFYKNRVRQYADFLHQEMCQAKERFKARLGAARQRGWEKFAENDLKRNPWGVVYKLAAEKFHRAGVLSCFAREDGTITLTQEETMTHLVVNLLPDDNPETNDHMQKIEQRNYNTIVPIGHDDDLVEAEELATIVASLKNNKAPGLDTINGRTVKMTHQWAGPALLRIYNACWHLGYFPKAWKKGKLVILLKDPTGDQSSIKNYRPIVLLPVYGKILEKLLKARLARLSPLHSGVQFGFVAGRSTSDALVRYKNTVKGSNKKYVMTIFVDVRGAFDNVWWPALIRNLRNRGIPHEMLVMLKSYLTDRGVEFTQGDVTVRKQTTKGCPQGSVLGPTLWNFILDPLLDSEWSIGVTATAYADDLAVVVARDGRAEMIATAQEALDKIAEWARGNKLSIPPKRRYTWSTGLLHACTIGTFDCSLGTFQ
jgi:hypothetical protein